MKCYDCFCDPLYRGLKQCFEHIALFEDQAMDIPADGSKGQGKTDGEIKHPLTLSHCSSTLHRWVRSPQDRVLQEHGLEQGCQTESQEGQVSAGFCGFLSISCQLRPADQGVSIL